MNWLSDTGVINNILISLHFIKIPVNFLADPKYFWAIAVISDIWKELGWSAIIYLAAISSIDPELYEAATMDGAEVLPKCSKSLYPVYAVGLFKSIIALILLISVNIVSKKLNDTSLF